MKKSLVLKILALLLAILIWFQVNLLKEHTVKLKIPVRVINVPDNIYVNKQEELALNFEVTGQGIVLLTFWLTNPTLDYDASSLTIGNNILAKERILPFLKKYKQLRFTPLDTLGHTSLSAERIVQKKVPIQLVFASDKDKEFFYSQQIDVEEKTVLISGPGKDIQNIDLIYTEEISEKILKEQKKLKFNLDNEKVLIIPAQLNLVRQNQSFITKTFSNIDIENNERLQIFPDQVSVIIEGKRDSLSSFNKQNIKASVNPSTGDISIILNHTNSLKVIDFTPQKVTIKKKD